MSKGLDSVRPSIRKLAGYVPGEQPQDRRYVKLNTNENPYPPSPQVLAAVAANATADLRLYPDPTADRLRDAAAATYGFHRDEILAGNGSDDLLAMIVRACIAPSDCVVYPFPTYSLYDTLVAIGDARAVHVPFGPEFHLPAREIEAAAGRVTFLCNPNSPSGTLFSLEEISALAARVRGLLVVDEAYVDFAAHSALPLVHERDNIIVLRTFSKSYSLAGMRIGLAFGPAPFIAELMKVKDSYNLTRVSIAAATVALQDQEWMRANVARVCATRTRLRQALLERHFAVPVSDANFLLARRPGTRLQPLYEALKRHGILVRYFDTAELNDALRITVGTDAEVDALLAALDVVGVT
jgi:histidinol-phosphate aminotransferase